MNPQTKRLRRSLKQSTTADRTPKPGRKRYRRSEEELIADLEAKIAALQQRKEVREMKTTPGFKFAINADRSLVRAAEKCREAGHTKLANALKAAHLALQPHLGVGEEWVEE